MIGVDEVGRGCLAGPLLVVAARAVSKLPAGLKDSKQLTVKKRLEFYEMLTRCCTFGEGWVSAYEIDDLGLAKALMLGVDRSLKKISAQIDDEIVMDGKYSYIPKKFNNSRAIVGGDNLVAIISAASIYAKVTRDRFMYDLSAKFPGYGFDHHVGYGTKKHLDAINALGEIEKVHRQTFNFPREISDKNIVYEAA